MNSLKNKPLDPVNHAGFLIWQVANNWEKQINNELKEFGLNQAEYFHLVSLFWLLENQEEVTQTEIARFADTIPMNTSKIMTKFEKKGLITRVAGSDSRSKSLCITESGEQIAIQATARLSRLSEQFFDKDDDNNFLNYLKYLKTK
ncbi:transcriptional regulator [Rivularia sp. PCC 7116]|uniref:MarR family winged helix-turn-helix transcriptional regulator n=1 Tax=Rivularia sp. PCC 7116 TaxID=373994 RepID=UPI00029EECC0|nr:MarR family transcriptional regulator [Rivularia sp. PCC 7116]AFY57865.1 transcriptional regulator [Rivularia sp. PCC 7116]